VYFKTTSTAATYTLSLHDALPIYREDQPVQVVVDVEVAGEARPRVPGLVPRPFGRLRLRQERHTSFGAERIATASGEDGKQGPRGLRRGALTAPRPRAVAVRTEVLAPAAVGVLVRFQPAHGAPDARIGGRHARRDQRGHDRPDPVDVVRA